MVDPLLANRLDAEARSVEFLDQKCADLLREARDAIDYLMRQGKAVKDLADAVGGCLSYALFIQAATENQFGKDSATHFYQKLLADSLRNTLNFARSMETMESSK